MIYVYGLLAILATAIFIGGRYLFYRYGRNDERLKNAEEQNEKLSNRPRTLDDVRDRLRKSIKK